MHLHICVLFYCLAFPKVTTVTLVSFGVLEVNVFVFSMSFCRTDVRGLVGTDRHYQSILRPSVIFSVCHSIFHLTDLICDLTV